MCLFKTPDMPTPQAPVEYAAQKAPNTQAAKGAGATLKDRMRAAAGTVLTGAQGVASAVDMSGKKTLLGA